MKAILTNEGEFSKYVDEENKKRCMKALAEQFIDMGELTDFFVNAGDGYSKDRVFVFEFLYVQYNEVVFEFSGTTK